MSIQSEIDRLAAAKQNMIQAIGNKGVDVPADARLDDFHPYIEAIRSTSSDFVVPLGSFNTSGGVIDAVINFGNYPFSGLVAVSDIFTCVASGTPGVSPKSSYWVSNVYSSNRDKPAYGLLTVKEESADSRMTWVICADGSMDDRLFTLYGLKQGGEK